MVGVPERVPELDLQELPEVTIGLRLAEPAQHLAEQLERLLEVAALEAAGGAAAAVALPDELAHMRGIGLQLPAFHAGVAAEGPPSPRHFLAAVAAEAAP